MSCHTTWNCRQTFIFVWFNRADSKRIVVSFLQCSTKPYIHNPLLVTNLCKGVCSVRWPVHDRQVPGAQHTHLHFARHDKRLKGQENGLQKFNCKRSPCLCSSCFAWYTTLLLAQLLSLSVYLGSWLLWSAATEFVSCNSWEKAGGKQQYPKMPSAMNT